MKIAFIGLGNMGGPMAHNLHKAGHEVRAFDLSQPARDKLAADGVAIAASATAAVQGAEAIVTMLPASQHVEALFLGSNGQPGLLAHIAKGALVIDSSTIAAATSRIPSYQVNPSTIDPADISAAHLSEKIARYGYDAWRLREIREQIVTSAIVVRPQGVISSKPPSPCTIRACWMPRIRITSAIGWTSSRRATPMIWNGVSTGFASGPSRFMIVGIASSRRTGPAWRIAGWWFGA